MSTHYLIDAHTVTVADSDINEARYNVTVSPLMGNFVVKVADTMPITQEQSNLANLIQAKYQAALAFYTTFANVVYEDFIDTPGVNVGSSVNILSGIRCTAKLNGGTVPGVLRTNTTALGGTPTLAVVMWEAYRIVNTDPKTGRLTREYQDAPVTDISTEVSFNNGSTWIAANDGGLLNITAPDQGSNLVLRFTNASSPNANVWLGGWSVLY